ncbi:MAG TPA: aromatic ring-hydroxylating dioxygenase subunit alpha [Polyangiaceae bacterium]|nr:aromatic ring-hydroxylating dioxygenase subunit alpha [Polyangiaceae bacterium]
MLHEKLIPPETKGHVSVARLGRFWYVACQTDELTDKPIARTILGTPLVLFRGAAGKAGALLDRCPHRNVPLSLGRVVGAGVLECAYHGWQFETDGRCAHIPGLLTLGTGSKQRRAPAAAVREQDGFVWIYPELDQQPESEPFALPQAGSDYARVVREVETEASLHATIENALDVPHTAFLHRGLFRGGKPSEIEATVRRAADRVEVQYDGEPRPSGIAGRVLSPGGGTVEHWDRFILPSIAQVEYRLGRDVHFRVTSLCTPENDFRTRMWAVVEFRTRFPSRAVQRILEPFALRIFGQDARILRAQTENIRRFGGEQFMSTDLDFLGPHIWRLLKQAESGEPGGDLVVERSVKFLA